MREHRESQGTQAAAEGPAETVRPGQTSAGGSFAGLLGLQRRAGNRAVVRALAVQRVRVDLPAGGQVGDGGASNLREAVLLVLPRLFDLDLLPQADFDSLVTTVTALPQGAPVTDRSVLAQVQAALRRMEEPVLTANGASSQGLRLSADVGRGRANVPTDVMAVQDALHRAWGLSDGDYGVEIAASRAAARAGTAVSVGDIPRTLAAIVEMKRTAVASPVSARRPVEPPIHADESGPPGPTGADPLAARSFEYAGFSVFVPAGAVRSRVNNVHVFWSAGPVVGGGHVGHHGLRGAAEGHDWIVIGVPGSGNHQITISAAQISAALESVGRPGAIARVRMSGHSRGNNGLGGTLLQRLIPGSLIDHVWVLDGSDMAELVSRGIRASGLSASQVTVDIVNSGPWLTDKHGHPRHNMVRGVTIEEIGEAGAKGIGYARLIGEAVATGRVPALPPGIASLVNAVGLPPRGTFTAAATAPRGRVRIQDFVASHRAALSAMLAGEGKVSNFLSLRPRVETSPFAFVEWHNLLNLNDPRADRRTWQSREPFVYAHHLFVAEIAEDMFR